MRIYKNKNPNKIRLSLLSMSRILFVVMPIFILIFYLYKTEHENYFIAIGFAILLISILLLYSLVSRRYRILLSGCRGEEELLKIIRHIHWDCECAVFTNNPIRHKNNSSEIDMLIVGERGILIIEVKNHSGLIIGADHDDFWVQRKKYREGKNTEKKMINPYKQIKRQRDILKAAFRENGLDVWIDNVLFFSYPHVKLKLKLRKRNYAFSSKNDLIDFINGYYSDSPLNKNQCLKIIDIIKDMSNEG